MKTVVISPGPDSALPHQIERTDQFHSFEMLAVQLRKHGLDLSCIQHPHQNCFDHIVIMMAERNLVAAKQPGIVVKVSAPHSCAQVAGIFLYDRHRVKNLRLKDCQGNPEKLCVMPDHSPVFLIIAGIHGQKDQIKGNRSVLLQFLQQLCQQKRILSARYAAGNPVPFLNQLIIADRFCKLRPDLFPVFFDQAFLCPQAPFGQRFRTFLR